MARDPIEVEEAFASKTADLHFLKMVYLISVALIGFDWFFLKEDFAKLEVKFR